MLVQSKKLYKEAVRHLAALKYNFTMKIINIFIAIIILSLTSCQNDNNHELIEVDNDNISLWAGEDTIVNILKGSGSYTIQSENEQIAIAKIIDSQIHITTKKPGQVLLIMKDSNGEQIQINIYANSFKGGWEIYYIEKGEFATRVKVTANDSSLEEQIENQVLTETMMRDRTKFSFNYSDHTLTIVKEEEIEGLFSFQELTLTMKLPEKEEIYHVSPLSKNTVILTQDLTEKYQNLYQDEEILEVSVSFLFNRYTL